VSQKEASHGNLSDYVSQHLIDYIRTNQLRSGAEVPSEVRVSSDLGISRGIVREAFRALKMAGVLEISNGRSPRVARISDEGIGQVLDHALSTEQVTIQQVLDLRAAIEIRGAELAATHRTDADVEALRKEVGNMQAFKAIQNRFVESDARFHETIAQSTGNPLFAIVGGALRAALKASIRTGLRNRTTVRQLDQIVATHRAIADAIGDRDAARARKYMAIHFDEAMRSFGLKAGR
jgi:DNA-binding FadR family transcriptional regulator